jgi:hypothetical protein
MANRLKAILGPSGLGYNIQDGSIGRRLTQNIGLGDTHSFADVKALAQQFQQLAASAPAGVQAQVSSLMGASTSYGQYPLSKIVGYYLSGATGTGTADVDYAAISGGINALNQILAGGPSPASLGLKTPSDILALGQQFQTLLQQVPSSLTTQANAILAKTTSPPQNTVTGIIKFYSANPGGGPGTYTERDYSFLASQYQALADLLSAPPPPVPMVAPSPYVSGPQNYLPTNTQGQPIYTPTPTTMPYVAPGTVPGYQTGTPGIPASLITGYQQPTGSYLPTPTPAPSFSPFSGVIDLSAVGLGQVPTIYAVGFAGLVGFILWRRSR